MNSSFPNISLSDLEEELLADLEHGARFFEPEFFATSSALELGVLTGVSLTERVGGALAGEGLAAGAASVGGLIGMAGGLLRGAAVVSNLFDREKGKAGSERSASLSGAELFKHCCIAQEFWEDLLPFERLTFSRKLSPKVVLNEICSSTEAFLRRNIIPAHKKQMKKIKRVLANYMDAERRQFFLSQQHLSLGGILCWLEAISAAILAEDSIVQHYVELQFTPNAQYLWTPSFSLKVDQFRRHRNAIVHGRAEGLNHQLYREICELIYGYPSLEEYITKPVVTTGFLPCLLLKRALIIAHDQHELAH